MEYKVLLFFLLGLSIAGIPLMMENYVSSMHISEVGHEMSLKDQVMRTRAQLTSRLKEVHTRALDVLQNQSIAHVSVGIGWSSSPDEYVFIEHHIHTHVEVIEGKPPYDVIDSPTYSFDEKTGALRGMINFDVNDTLMAVIGSGTSISGVGGGRETMLYGVYELPHQHHERACILSLDVDGTIHLSYQGISITLKSGEEWVNISSETDVQQAGTGSVTVNLTITDRIVNHGILSKLELERWS